PTSIFRNVVDQIIETGEVRRGLVGITLADLDVARRSAPGLSATSGAYVAGVARGLPAEKAGLREGDVVLEVDGQSVQDSSQLRRYIGGRRPGATVNLVVDRAGRRQNFRIELVQRTEDSLFGGVIRGATLQPMNPQRARKFGYDPNVSGLVIVAMEKDGALQKAGLQVGDVLVAGPTGMIRSVNQLRALIELAEDEDETLQIAFLRDGQKKLLVLR
ncbi:MAG: PDZ domain-containing protein, partial [Planctomycetota bacterium]